MYSNLGLPALEAIPLPANCSTCITNYKYFVWSVQNQIIFDNSEEEERRRRLPSKEMNSAEL